MTTLTRQFYEKKLKKNRALVLSAPLGNLHVRFADVKLWNYIVDYLADHPRCGSIYIREADRQSTKIDCPEEAHAIVFIIYKGYVLQHILVVVRQFTNSTIFDDYP